MPLLHKKITFCNKTITLYYLIRGNTNFILFLITKFYLAKGAEKWIIKNCITINFSQLRFYNKLQKNSPDHQL